MTENVAMMNNSLMSIIWLLFLFFIFWFELLAYCSIFRRLVSDVSVGHDLDFSNTVTCDCITK